MTIMTLEQYESVLAVLKLLGDLHVPKVDEALSEFICNNADEWTVCDYCSEFKVDCHCDYSPRYDEDRGCRCNNADGKCYC